MTTDELVKAVAKAAYLAGAPQGADWNAVDPHHKATVWLPMARAIIPLVQQAEQADVVKWLRKLHEKGDKKDLRNPNFVELIAVFTMVAAAIERGEYKQESQP